MIAHSGHAVKAAVMQARIEKSTVYIMIDRHQQIHITKKPEKKMLLAETVTYIENK